MPNDAKTYATSVHLHVATTRVAALRGALKQWLATERRRAGRPGGPPRAFAKATVPDTTIASPEIGRCSVVARWYGPVDDADGYAREIRAWIERATEVEAREAYFFVGLSTLRTVDVTDAPDATCDRCGIVATSEDEMYAMRELDIDDDGFHIRCCSACVRTTPSTERQPVGGTRMFAEHEWTV